MIKEFITFGGGAKNFHEAGERLKNQALNLELFDVAAPKLTGQ